MLKRTVSGLVWTYAAYLTWKLGAGFAGLPQYLDLIAMVASASIGSIIGWRTVPDSRSSRRIARIPPRAVPGDRATPKPLP